MKRLRNGQTVRILVDIDANWCTKGKLGVLIDIDRDIVLVKCPNGGRYQPRVGYVDPVDSLWVNADEVQAVSVLRMPISPIFLREVCDETV